MSNGKAIQKALLTIILGLNKSLPATGTSLGSFIVDGRNASDFEIVCVTSLIPDDWVFLFRTINTNKH